jgi:Fe-S-cluster containining protein
MGEISLEKLFYDEGLHFSCKQCSSCCRYESGFVFLSEKDVNLLADALQMTYNNFIEVYCRWIPFGDRMERLSLKELSNYDCIFWKNGGCTVYQSRPLQCRTFPFWQSVLRSEDAWDATKEECPGMGQGSLHSKEEIEARLLERESEPVIERKQK